MKRTFEVYLRDGTVETFQRDSVRFQGCWVIFSNGAEYQISTEVRAYPERLVSGVNEQFTADQTPVAPPLTSPPLLSEGRVLLGDYDLRPGETQMDTAEGRRALGLAYDADDDEYHLRE